ncbi:ABC transporter ATP-binding protein [Nocardioides sp. 503]|uniref:ABC transporter ATP-binding protein n=1 Tax=Nocardioides sp. 503 TaxID=2508326 RepID=UPI00106F2127|nr:ABC transporter ATP-binding protein [Nocardioides sp. 503]
MDTTTSSRPDRRPDARSRPAAGEPAIRVRDLRRSYGSGKQAFEAVRGVDLDVEAGTVSALLGTNGAGKTSTMELVEGLGRPSAGELRVLGLDPVADRAALRPRLGILLQRSGFSGDLSVRETLQMWHSTLSRPRPVDEMLAALRLDGRADTRVVGLSGGEQRRLDLACTLMGDPEVVLLDEPTTGLDPESRRDVWSLIRALRDGGTTVLLTTHYLDEAEALADELAIMHEGRIVRRGTVAQIVEGHPSVVRFTTPDRPLPDLRGTATTERGTTVVETDDLQRTLTALLTWADRDGVRLTDLSARTASLESVFLEVADQEGSTR